MKSTDDRKLFGSLIGASAASGDIATIPQTQATAGDGTASVALGFPPETFIARAAGGEPPRGQDMNGLLNLLSGAVQVLQAGYLGAFDSSFAQSIGGYPAGAIVSGSTAGTFWVSTADANVSTPAQQEQRGRAYLTVWLSSMVATHLPARRTLPAHSMLPAPLRRWWHLPPRRLHCGGEAPTGALTAMTGLTGIICTSTTTTQLILPRGL